MLLSVHYCCYHFVKGGLRLVAVCMIKVLCVLSSLQLFRLKPLLICFSFAFKCMPSHHPISGHNRPVSETPFQWRFAGGPIVARFYVLTVCISFFVF